MFRKFLAASSALVIMACMGTAAHAQAPANDDCGGAIDVGALPATIDGSTTSATADAAPDCALVAPVAAGVWYTFVGTGFETEVSVCSAGGTANYDSQIAVYSGDCGDLLCISSNDNSAGCVAGNDSASRTVFCAAPGTTYYVLVAGKAGATGDFTLAVDDTFAADPCSTTCAAPEVVVVGDGFQRDIRYRTPIDADGDSTLDIDPNHNGPGPDCLALTEDRNGNMVCTAVVDGTNDWWFEFQGTGEEVEFLALAIGNFWDPDMSVYCGTQGCDALECVGAAGGRDPGNGDFDPTITICTDIDTTYYIHITGNLLQPEDRQTGIFELHVLATDPGTMCGEGATCAGPPPGGDCCDDCELLTLLDPVLPGGVPSSHPCMMELPDDPANPTTAPIFALPETDAVPGDECCTTFETIRLALPGPPSVPSSHPCFVPAEPEEPTSTAPTSDVTTSFDGGLLGDDTQAGGIDLLTPGTGSNDDASRTSGRTRRHR